MLVHNEQKTTLATIVRILGNENPPRDIPGMRLKVLHKILQEEPTPPNVNKLFILNRFEDIQYRRAVCELLDCYNSKYITIPLDRTSVLSATTRIDKIKNAIEINSARNLAFDWCKQSSLYVIILDGDCMFDEHGLEAVLQTISRSASKYISIPHKRQNQHKLAEPMLAFRHDADLRFDESIPFGEGDKLDLLFKLGHDRTPGSGHCSLSPNSVTTISGYVLHLTTGPDQLEHDTLMRINYRNQSMDKLLDRITHRPYRLGGTNKYYETIPGYFDFTGQYSGIALDAPDNAKIVEVGSWLGKSVVYLANEFRGYGKRVSIHAVDTWDGGNDDMLVAEVQKHGGPDVVYDMFCRNLQLGCVSKLVTPIRKKSTEAAALFADKSLDVVWIDAGHAYYEVLSDLVAWYPKVRIGGLIGGHDYYPLHRISLDGVVRAVDEFFVDKPLELQPCGRSWKSVVYDDNWPDYRTRRWA